MSVDTISPKEIIIKDTEVLTGLMERRFSPLLIKIITHIANKWGLLMTESYREKRHMNDLHGCQPVRAIDLRSRCYEYPKEIEKEINRIWIYDPKRPHMQVAVIHKVGNGGIHFHIQVHERTIQRCYAA